MCLEPFSFFFSASVWRYANIAVLIIAYKERDNASSRRILTASIRRSMGHEIRLFLGGHGRRGKVSRAGKAGIIVLPNMVIPREQTISGIIDRLSKLFCCPSFIVILATETEQRQ